jgi:multiple sugar transport system permease protein
MSTTTTDIFEQDQADILEQPKKVTPSRWRWTDIIMQVTLISVGLLIAFPVLLAIFTSFKIPTDVINYPPTFFPSEWTMDNYIRAWNAKPFGRFFFNSVVQTGVIVVFQVFFSILAAYAFSVLRWPGRDLLFYLILGSLMVPFQLTFIPNFVLVSSLPGHCMEWLGWSREVCRQFGTNSYFGLTVPFLASAFGIFLLRQFFLTIPRDLHDSAQIDGASNWRFLWQILVPLSKGSISAFTIFAFLSAWSQYLWPLVITNEENMRTIQIAIRFFLFEQERGADWGAIMAVAVIALLPTLLIFLVAQRQLVKGIAMTGMKG